jgi:hypothetical protein
MSDIRKHIDLVTESEPSLDVQGVVDSILDYKLHNRLESKEQILKLIKHYGAKYTSYKVDRKKFIMDVIDVLKARMNQYDWPN